MKPGYSDIIAWLQPAVQLPFADCFTLTLLNGTVLRFTNFDVPVTIGDSSFAANGVRISGLKLKQTTGVDIDTQEIDFIYGPADMIDGVPVAQALRQHVLDKCEIQRDRAFFNIATDWLDPLNGATATGSVMLFKGRVADITAIGRTTATINVKSDLVLLDIDYPRNIWQASCLHTLFDAGCGLSRAAYQGSGTVGAGATYSTIPFETGGSGAEIAAVMSGTPGAPLGNVVLTSPLSINQTYGAAPDVTISDPTGTGAAVISLWDSSVGLYGFLIVAAGEGYTNPTAVIDAGTDGQATAQVTLGPGSLAVSGFTVVAGGAGYSHLAQFSIAGGGGTGALGVPVIAGGHITGGTLLNGGSTYSSAPTVTVVDDPALNFGQGTIQFTSGANDGVVAQIATATGSTLQLINPLNYLPAAGDTFLIWPGCDHSLGAGGCAKFNNQANYRGFPYVPPPETAY